MKTCCFDYFLDSLTYLVELDARLAYLDCFVDCLSCCVDDLSDIRVNFTYLDHQVAVAVVSIIVCCRVNVHCVAFFQYPLVWNSMNQNLIHGCADWFWEVHEPNRCGIRSLFDDAIMNKFIDIVCRHSSLCILLHFKQRSWNYLRRFPQPQINLWLLSTACFACTTGSPW